MTKPYKKEQLPFKLPAPHLADFVIGNNAELVDAVRQLISTPTSHPIIYVWGDISVGKTHLLRSALSHARTLTPDRPVYYVDAHTNPTIPPTELNGLLIIDNVESLPPDQQINLFDWCNHLPHAPGKKSLLVSSNHAPNALPLESKVKARLLSELVLRLHPLSEEDKQQALVNYAKRHGFTLPPAIAHLFLIQLPRRMTDLATALGELDEFLTGEKKPLTENRVRQWLANKRNPTSSP